MLQLPDNVRQDLVKLVPSSVVNEISCFIFYDYHPRDLRKVEIIICTCNGEVKEFNQREIVCSLSLGKKATNIRIIRNHKGELFYLLEVDDELYILSRKENLVIHKHIKNVESYDLDDSVCRGQACLKVICKDDAVPLIYDDNFESLGDAALELCQYGAHDNLPIMLDLATKFTQAQYGVKCYEKALREIISLRQSSAFVNYKRINSNTMDGVYDSMTTQGDGALKIKSTPWVKICNKKIVIVVKVLNSNKISVEDVHVLLHRTTRSSVVYDTKLFEQTLTLPYWREKQSQNIKYNCEIAVVVVIDLKELKYTVTTKTEFDAVICYKNREKEYLLSIGTIVISALDTMGEQFDALSNTQVANITQDHMVMLAILATSKLTDLRLRHIKNGIESDLEMKHLFCDLLKMEQLKSTSNAVFIHRISPYHILHGVMVIIQQDDERANSDSFTISLCARTPCQVLAFIHYIQDGVPHRIVTTTVNQTITAKTTSLINYNEEIVDKAPNRDYNIYGESILNQTQILLEYLDSCMIKMNISKNPVVQIKVGSEIDVFADGLAGFKEFRKMMLEEAFIGIQSIEADRSGPECMVVSMDNDF